MIVVHESEDRSFDYREFDQNTYVISYFIDLCDIFIDLLQIDLHLSPN